MPQFFKSLFGASDKDTIPINQYEGFKDNGAIVLQDRRGTRKAEIPDVSEKGMHGMGDDPMAIYRPSGAKSVDASKAIANFTGWTFAAVNAIASEVANIQYRLYRVNGEKHDEVIDHPVLDLLESVNDGMTGTELKYITMTHLELTGNAYWLLEGVSDDRTPPRAIYPLNPGRVRVKLNKSVFPYKISHYEFTLDGKVFRFEPYQILHMKYPDPNDPFVGIGVPQTIPSWIDSDNYAMEYNRKFFINGAQVGLYIQTDTNVEGNIDRIRKGFGNRHEGVENAHKVPVLPKGAKLEHTGVTQRDMDFAKLTDATRDRILAGFRVSKTILGTAESETNRATAETADYVFSKRTIKPKMSLLVSYLNEFLVPRYDEDDLYLTFIDPTPEDKQFKTLEMQAVVANMPIMTQNEARKAYMGLDPIEGGDTLLQPTSMMEAGTTPQATGEVTTPQLAKTAEGWTTKAIRIRAGGKTAHSASAKMRRALMNSFKKQLDSVPDFQVRSVTELTKSEYMEHYKRFDARSRRTQEQLHKVFQGINTKQKEEVLANLPDATGVEKSLDELFDVKEWMAIVIDLATPILTLLAKDEAAAALAMIGARHLDILADESTRQALDRGISKMARSYNETTLQQLKDVLGEKLTQEGGTNLRELTEAVDGVYSFADERRAGLIAKTESYRTSNWANREAWSQSGVVKSLKWFTAEDAHVCPQCEALDGEVINIDSKFFSDSYADGMTPPRHPDCFTGDTVIVSPDAERALKMSYSGDVIELSFADGTKLSVTPNHPILTQRGFVAARLLKQGDKAIKVLLDKGVVLGDPNNESAPANIGEVFSALRETRGMTTSCVPVSPEYFHGDAEHGKGEIDIVSADGLLRDNLDSSTPQPVRKALLNRTGITLQSLNGESDLASMLLALALASDGIVRGDSIAPILLGRSPTYEDTIRLKSPANYNARLHKATTDSSSIDIQGLSDAQLSLAGAITTNDVVGIERKPFHGFVYDVSAMSTVYTANGILTSNCRCYTRPWDIEI